jgi:hypothetical protein
MFSSKYVTFIYFLKKFILLGVLKEVLRPKQMN